MNSPLKWLSCIGLLALPWLLTACVSTPRSSSETVVLKDSAPDVDLDVTHLPDAVPKHELIKNSGNKTPYTVLGKTYHVNFSTKGFAETGYASWYGKKFHGNKTSNGEIYDMYGMTAAHKTLPIPAYVRVVNLENDLSCVVRVNDRGPFHEGRVIDLSYAAAKKLGFHHKGTAKVRIETIEQTPFASPLPASENPQAGLVPVIQQGGASQAPPQGPLSYLQVGAFSKQETADLLRNRLRPSLSGKVLVRSEPQQNLFKVMVGPIMDNMELLAVRQKLAEAQLPNGHLVEF